MPEPISIGSSTVRDNRIAFFQHRNKIIGKVLDSLNHAFIFRT